MDEHTPVLLHEIIAGLNIRPTGTFVDLTFGRGGHAKEILKSLTSGHLFAFDRDITAIAAGQVLVANYPASLTLIHDNFTQAAIRLMELGIHQVDGIVMDLGVSSPQFDDYTRGFSYREDAPLDMRMDQRQRLTAEIIVNTADIATLSHIFREYGDEPQAFQIAKAIVKARTLGPITTTGQLVTIIKSVKPQKELKKKGHPAKQAFQALRIATNDEMVNLEQGLKVATSLLAPLGRLAVITFHSGEDRLVKNYFKSLTTTSGSRYGIEAMIKPEEPKFTLYNRQVILPTAQEIIDNHRASSAKLRIIQRK
ncbi:MAG TPA: 16S rRNA (cytosine(1402)-N(4))-methyltransferase [Firmicutes bacterium]|nr:16S rRNA (cytosine(1402)-N(4))-methyltransferase [Bacillota bacterium]